VPIPAPTRALLTIAGVLESPYTWIAAAGGCAVTAVAGAVIAANAAARLALDRMLLRLPLIGPLVRKATLARVSRMLGTLVRSGVDLVAALDAVIPVAGTPVYRGVLDECRRRLRAGDPLSAPLAASPEIDRLFVALVRVGEETGALDDMLLKAAEYFESDVESAISVLSATLEPGLIVFLGIVVGSIVFSIFLPLYSLIGSLAK
jgi:type IV pilus assembly protein PilC